MTDRPKPTPLRQGHFECKSTPYDQWTPDGEMEATAGANGLEIAITDDAAADSYNMEVTATIHMSRDDAIRFRDWLNEMLA